MLIVSVVLTIVSIIVGALAEDECYDGIFSISIITTVVLMAIDLFIVLWILFAGSSMFTINDKIAMYQEENKNIELQVEILVKNYMNYEKDTYKEFKDVNPVVIVNMFPELKSDELVSKQIDVYLKNNEKIKELKEEKINIKVAKWLLYFGSDKQNK